MPFWIQGSATKCSRNAASLSASTTSRTSFSSSGPPRTTVPSSTSASMKTACSSQPACSRRPFDQSQGPRCSSVTRNSCLTGAAWRLAADGAEDEVRREAEDESGEEAPGDERLVAEPGVHLHELDDHVQDRAGCEGEEADGDRGARPGLADDGAEERRRSADDAEEDQEAPGGTLRVACERRDDPKAFGAVVKREADDQHECKARLPERRRLADRKTLGEVVQADSGRDQHCEPTRAGHAVDPRRLDPGRRRRAGAEHALRALLGHPAVVRDEAEKAEAKPAGEQRGVAHEVAPGAA